MLKPSRSSAIVCMLLELAKLENWLHSGLLLQPLFCFVAVGLSCPVVSDFKRYSSHDKPCSLIPTEICSGSEYNGRSNLEMAVTFHVL